MKKISKKKLKEILNNHKLWLEDNGGERANLRSADLSYANLRYADLRSTDLRYADLRYADLSYANLRYADLRSADLRSADLRSADLRYADLRYADLDKRYIIISCIGSRKDLTTYCFEDDYIWCGCFQGSFLEFENKVKLEYEGKEDKKQFYNEYMGFINYIKMLRGIE